MHTQEPYRNPTSLLAECSQRCLRYIANFLRARISRIWGMQMRAVNLGNKYAVSFNIAAAMHAASNLTLV